MRKRRKTRDEQELAESLASASTRETAKREKRSRRSKKSQPTTLEDVARPLFMSASLPAPPIPPVPVVVPSRPSPSSSKPETFNVNSIQNYQELLAALEAKKVQITLGNDIIAEDNILINYDVAINFNGHSIISDESIPAARVLDIRSGEVTLTGRGKIFAMGERSVALRIFGAISTEMPSYTTVTIDEGISLFSPSSYAIFIAANLGVAYGLRLNFAGEIIAHDGICLSSDVRGRRPRNLPLITLSSGARIVVDETSGAALHAAGFGIWEIGAVCLRGASGLRAQAGQIKCSHTQMIACGPVNLATLEIESNELSDLELLVDGGTYVSENSYVIAGEATSLKRLVIKDADLRGARGDYPADIRTILERPLLAPPPPDLANESLPAMPLNLPAAPAPVTHLPPQPPVEPAPKVVETPPAPDEREAARAALVDALSDLEKLRSSDYVSGFSEFRRAINQAKKTLRHNHSTLTDIRDAASNLLSAFDQLEERDDFSLSDEELDELFYHGAILEEMAADDEKPVQRPQLPETKETKEETPLAPVVPATPAVRPSIPLPSPAPTSTPTVTPTPAPSPVPPIAAPNNPVATPVITPAEPNLSTLREVISTIARLDAQKYSTSSYQALLQTLAKVKDVIGRDCVRQAEIDQISSRLLTGLAELEPAPALHNLSAFSSGAIDEMSPAPHWSAGVSAIDEATPFDYSNYSAPRARKVPKLRAPLGGFFKSFSAGARAGLATYRRARRSAKTS